MLKRLVNWIKQNKLAVFVLVILFWFIYKSYFQNLTRFNSGSSSTAFMGASVALPNAIGLSKMADRAQIREFTKEAPPVPGANRLVIHETNLSLLVKDVAKTLNAIEQAAVTAGGYLVNSNLSLPEAGANGTIIIRVPETQRSTTLNTIKSLGVKTVSENVTGEDVTDEYVDINARLDTLNKTKAKFEALLEQSTEIQDTLQVQREIINLQSQIDALKGQQKYLEQSADLAKITVYLSTDELALPYAPTESWRPQVIFKTAVRSLIGFFRSMGTYLIWIAVFAIIWLPILLIILWYNHRKSKLKLPEG